MVAKMFVEHQIIVVKTNHTTVDVRRTIQRAAKYLMFYEHLAVVTFIFSTIIRCFTNIGQKYLIKK